MANVNRGEVTLRLGGSTYTLRPTFEALCEMEDIVGDSVIRILYSMQGGRITLKNLANIIWAGMRGYDPVESPSIAEVGEMILKEGVASVMTQTNNGVDHTPSVQIYMLNGILGGEEPEEENTGKKPMTETQETANQ